MCHSYAALLGCILSKAARDTRDTQPQQVGFAACDAAVAVAVAAVVVVVVVSSSV